MSIYATLWRLQFPEHGDDHSECGWVEVMAQGVPDHIGSPASGYGYEDGDPFASFLPAAISTPSEDLDAPMGLRAVVFIKAATPKGTERSHQEYVDTLLVLSGDEYQQMPFSELHRRLSESLRGDLPRCIGEVWLPDGRIRLLHEGGSLRDVARSTDSEVQRKPS